MTDLNLNAIIDELNHRIERSYEMDKFMARLTGGDEPDKASPVYAFQWAEGAIHESVKKAEMHRLLNAAKAAVKRVSDGAQTEAEALDFIKGFYQKEVLRRAGNIASSTSRLSNLIEDYERKVMVEIHGWLDGECFSGF